MKKLPQLLNATPRQLILRALARAHCGLIAAILFATVFAILNHYQLLSHPIYPIFARGLLMALPAALSYYAVKRLRTMWQYLLAAALLTGLGWLLAGHLGGALLTAIVCFFRGRMRLLEEEEGPTRSMFDYAYLPALGLFAAVFLLSAIVGIPDLQRLSLLGGVLYLLVCIAFRGLSRLDEYLTLNQSMHGLPERRIQRMAGAAVAAAAMLAALLLLPPALGASGGVRIRLPENLPTQSGELDDAVEEPPPQGMGQSQMMMEMFGEPTWQIPPIVTYIFLGAVGVFLAAGLCAAVWRLFKDFGRSYTDSRDLVQHLTKDDQDQGAALRRRWKLPGDWDRSPNAVVRRRYRKAVLKLMEEAPEAWLSPAEIEERAGLESPRLHELYEKARYGQQGCTAEEAREAGRIELR